MAQMNPTLNRTQSVTARVQAVVATLQEAVRRRALYRRTLRELNTLSPREMADLGINPSMILQIAREAAYGK